MQTTRITINFVENGYLIDRHFDDGSTKQHVSNTAEGVRDIIYDIIPKG